MVAKNECATATATITVKTNPWLVRGLMRYEEEDLAYIDRKVVEAKRMADPEDRRRHLQDVVDLYASKYFVKRTAEGLLSNSEFDLVKMHRILVDIADDPDESEGTDYRIVMAKYLEKYDDDKI